jgi:hypothetical protein
MDDALETAESSLRTSSTGDGFGKSSLCLRGVQDLVGSVSPEDLNSHEGVSKLIETNIIPENFGVTLGGDAETGDVLRRTLMVEAAEGHLVAIHFNEVQSERLAFFFTCSQEQMVEERERMEAQAKLEVARPGMVPQGARLPR